MSRSNRAMWTSSVSSRLWTAGILCASNQAQHIQWSGNVSDIYFCNGTLCMYVEMFGTPPPPPPPRHHLHFGCQASPPFLELGDGNVSCLQIRSDRLDTANLSLHVETRQGRKEKRADPLLKCFQTENRSADAWMKSLAR